jgi:glycosyltransferase involved in cell wall biosynthesis
MALISVIIPTYNATPFLRETLASVFAQTLPPAEVVIVDDCSPDSTVALVESIATTAPVPVRVIRLPANSGGPAKPLNVGIEAAVGELIATLDHDDTFPTDKLANQFAVFKACPGLGMVFGDVRCVGPDDDLNRKLENWGRAGIESLSKSPSQSGGRLITCEDATASLVGSMCFVQTCSNMLFPKAVWRACGGFDEKCTVSADFAFLAAVVLRYPVGYVPGPSADWRVHPDSFYRTATLKARVRDILRVYRAIWATQLPGHVRAELRSAIRRVAFEAAYSLRKSGDHRGASECLGTAVRIAGPWAAGTVEILKLLPDFVLQRGGWLSRHRSAN